LATPGQLDVGRVGLALAIVLTLIFVMRWAGRKFFQAPRSPFQRGDEDPFAAGHLAKTTASHDPDRPAHRRGGGRGWTDVAMSEITDSDEAAALVAQLADEKSHQSSKGFGALFHRTEASFEESLNSEERKPAIADSPSAHDRRLMTLAEKSTSLPTKFASCRPSFDSS